jgi:hypothetical protein
MGGLDFHVDPPAALRLDLHVQDAGQDGYPGIEEGKGHSSLFEALHFRPSIFPARTFP